MNILALLPWPWRLGALAALLAAFLGLYTWRVHVERGVGRAEVQLRWDAAEGRRKDVAIAQQEANAKETFRRLELGAEAERIRNAKLQAADARIAGLLGQLRDRPERPGAGGGGNVPVDPAPRQACTGAGLYRADAAFLVWYAANTARLVAERDYCHDRYDALKAPRP